MFSCEFLSFHTSKIGGYETAAAEGWLLYSSQWRLAE
jgi:hypothetical protein